MKKVILSCLVATMLLISTVSFAADVSDNMPVLVSGSCVLPDCGGILYQFSDSLPPGLHNTRVCEHGNITSTDSQYQTMTITYDRCNRCGVTTNMTEKTAAYWRCNYRPAPAKPYYYTSQTQ